jgi:putative transposase
LSAYRNGVKLGFSRQDKPADSAFIESLNGKSRADYPDTNWFLSLDQAHARCQDSRRDYNEVRPQSAIGN